MSDKRPIISSTQFAHLIGGSREIATGKKGKASGYYVSRNSQIPLEAGGSPNLVTGLTKPINVQEHLAKIKGVAEKIVPTGWMSARAATAKESKNVHQGIWRDEESGKTYLGISDRIGDRSSESSLEEALTRGISQNQLGVYVGSTGKTMKTHYEDKKTGKKTVNPAATMTLKYLKQQKEQKKQSRKMTALDKSAAIEAFKKAN